MPLTETELTALDRRLSGIEATLTKLLDQTSADHDVLTRVEQALQALPDHENRIRALEAAIAELQGGRKTLVWLAGLLGVGGGGATAAVVGQIVNGG